MAINTTDFNNTYTAMRMCLLLLLAISVGLGSAVPLDDLFKNGEQPITRVSSDESVMGFGDLTKIAGEIQYLLYTRRNPQVAQVMMMDDDASVIYSNFNGKLPTVVIVHGWVSQHDENMNPTLRDVFLAKDDLNVIICDWRRFALGDYATAANFVRDVGRALGNFVAYLNRMIAAQFNNVHLVGIGLGAHVVGNAGRQLGGRAARITGLDPAGSLFNKNANALCSTDAVYVEAIHTDGSSRGFGIGSAIAQVDFFPNGGNSQPGCSSNHCHHNRAWELFASTVTNNHLSGRRCLTALQMLINTCSGTRLNMGNDILNKSGSGSYRVSTGRNYPF